jgi:hypothetical protein
MYCCRNSTQAVNGDGGGACLPACLPVCFWNHLHVLLRVGHGEGKQTRENNREKVPLWADIGNGPRPPGLSGICPLEFHRIWIAGLSVCTSAAGAVETSSESLPCKASLRQLTVVHLDSIYNCQGLKMPRDGQHTRQTFLSCTRSTCNATDRYDRGVVHIYTDHHYYYLVHMCPTTKKNCRWTYSLQAL